MFYTKTVDSFFHLYGCGYHHNRVDDIPMIAGTHVADDDPVAFYLGYYYGVLILRTLVYGL
jgi:hypothetical protein